ncbi:MAG: response regulator [Desulfosalsimonadaceae bacterium]
MRFIRLLGYYTTKAKGEGTGMGLAVVQGIVKNYGGTIAVNSEVGKGTTFRIDFRMAEENLPSPQGSAPGDTAPGGHEHILVVDDENLVTDINRQTLESLGYQVSSFTCSEKALEAFRARPGHYDLVLTDMTMPRLNGLQLAEKVLAARPGMPIIICTGFSDLITEEKIQLAGIRKLIMKPVFRKDLALAIRRVLDSEKGEKTDIK